MKLNRFAVAHPVIVSMTILALSVFGIVSLADTNVEFMSNMSMPEVFVVTVYPGASASDVEESVTDVLENDFVTLPGFKSVSSTSMNSVSSVSIAFQDGIDANEQINEVRNRINQLIDELPAGISGTPTALVGGTTMLPIASFVVEGGEDLNAISDYVENELKPRITKIEGVSTVTLNGTRKPRLDVKLRLDDLEAKGVSPTIVYQVLSMANFSVPLDSVPYATSVVNAKYEGNYSSLDDIRKLPVGASLDGGVVTLEDVADVDFLYEDEGYYVSKDGKEVITVDVCKRSDGNTLEITKKIKEVLAEEEAYSNGALKFTMVNDDSVIIKTSLETVINSGVMGMLIAIFIIFIFLVDIKATIIIGLSIPLSIFFSFIGMRVMGITVNLMSLSGLVVALGNIVDAAIVVLDQVYRYYQQTKNGKALYSVNESIFKGVDDVGIAVLGGGLTTIVVFIPIAMMDGLVGMILKDVAISFMLALGSSLLVALLYIPFFMKKMLKEDPASRMSGKETFAAKGMKKVEVLYAKSLDFTIEHTPFFLIIVILILLLTVYVLPNMRFSFIPSTDNSDFYINLTFPENYSLEDTKAAVEKASLILKEEVPEIKTYVAYSGKSMNFTDFANKVNTAAIHVVLVPVKERDRDIHDIILDMQYILDEQLIDANVEVSNGGYDRLVSFVADGAGYGITLVSEDMDALYKAAKEIEIELKKNPEVITTSMNATNDASSAVVSATYDMLSSMGMTAQSAGQTAAILYYGMDIGKYTDSAMDKRFDIHLYSDVPEKRMNEETLNQILVTSMIGRTSNLNTIAEIDLEKELSQINHNDRAKTITVSALLTGESTDNVTRSINEYLERNPLPSNVTTQQGGLGSLVTDAAGPIIGALLIAIFLCYLVMVAVFERYDQPFLIMLLFPFSLIGAVLGLSVFASSLSMVSIMGIVALVGMLVNNGIVICDYANLRRREMREEELTKQGVAFDEYTTTLGLLSYEEEMAILKENITKGTATRLRSILMTTLTTIMGVVPMAFATGEGSEIYAPLGQVIMGGLFSSTILTLYIMPVYYYLLERFRLRKLYKKKAKEMTNEEK